MINLDDELAGEYLAECREHLATMETDLLAMEQRGAKIDEEQVNRVFRAVHSVKGGAGFFNLGNIRELAHQAENALALICSRKMTPTPERIRVLLSATDTLRELTQYPEASDQADIGEIIADLARVCADGWPATPASRPDSRLRILLVEDDFASRLVMHVFLSRYGECHIAVNGKEAVDAFRSSLQQGKPYQLICMDILMPEMDGRAAVRQIREWEEAQDIRSTNGVKIVMTTAVDDVKEVVRCFRELCDAYLMKPIDLSKLLAHMKALHLVP